MVEVASMAMQRSLSAVVLGHESGEMRGRAAVAGTRYAASGRGCQQFKCSNGYVLDACVCKIVPCMSFCQVRSIQAPG